MKLTYAAARPIRVGDENREPGDLVPEATQWRNVDLYVSRGEIFPVLVSTLTEEQQEYIALWEEAIVDESMAVIENIENSKAEDNDEDGEQTVFEDMPSLSASKQVWFDYASEYFDSGDLVGLSKKQLIELLTNDSEESSNG